MNLEIGSNYTLVSRTTNSRDFNRVFPIVFPESQSTEEEPECYAFVTNGTVSLPLYRNQKNFIMTEGGKTFDNLTYRPLVLYDMKGVIVRELVAYTDGSAVVSGKDKGKGGFGACICEGEDFFYKSVGYFPTKIGRMELMALLFTLQYSDKLTCHSVKLQVYSDSQYVVKSFTDKRLQNWIANGWYNSNHVITEIDGKFFDSGGYVDFTKHKHEFITMPIFGYNNFVAAFRYCSLTRRQLETLALSCKK